VTTAYLGLGSNLGDRAGYLRAALSAIAMRCTVYSVSSLYETDPIGPPQPMYFNAAAEIDTDLPPDELLAFLKSIELDLGRKREHEPNSPREIDIDILLYGESVVDAPGIAIPHPRMTQRAFVLLPLAEIAGGLREPVSGRAISELCAAVDGDGVERVAASGWEFE
jgi:2-amino-4-hydroxy-6-hydroxymethyldihydropteridine diphosphokinase